MSSAFLLSASSRQSEASFLESILDFSLKPTLPHLLQKIKANLSEPADSLMLSALSEA